MPDVKKTSVLAVGVLLLFVTACGPSAEKSDPGVATAQSGPAATARSSASSAASAVTQRPLIRPDASVDEIIALNNAYFRCLGDHGVPLLTTRDPKLVGKPRADLSTPQYKAAGDACASKQPESWLEVEARTDPQYRDRQRAEVQCLKDKGIKTELQGDPPHITFTDDRQVGQALDIAKDCEKQVFRDVMDKFNAR